MIGSIKSLTNKALRSLGYELRAYDGGNPHFQEHAALMDPRIGMIVDVGANHGQYGSRIRKILPDTPICSFEPLPDAFSELSRKAAADGHWQTFNVGLGSASSRLDFIVAGNSKSSSFLEMQDVHISAAPNSEPVYTISVQVEPLDAFLDRFPPSVFLKIDTQGYELEVLSGAHNTLDRALYVYIEASFVELYKGSPLAHDVMARMQELGFEVRTITPGFSDIGNAKLLQADILFSRQNVS